MGSIKDAKNAPVENIARAMEILASSIAPKKQIQCAAIMIPAIDNFKIDLGLILILTFATLM